MIRCLVLSSSLLLVVPLFGCGSITVEGEGIDGFTPRSQVWEVQTAGGSNRHRLVLTSVSDYCRKKKAAEQGRIDAEAAHQERLTSGVGACESEDQRLDDLADAYAALEGDSVAFLEVVIDREDESAADAKTVPSEGDYHQAGTPGEGNFSAQLRHYNGDLLGNRAEAYVCLTDEAEDVESYTEFTTQVEPGLLEVWDVDAGDMTLESAGDSAWNVSLNGDLMQGSTTVGSLQASFKAVRCEVPVESISQE